MRPREGGLTTEVLEFVWRRKTVSRAEIARHTGRSRSTISAVVGRLLPTGLIEEVGSGESRGGRRPILMQFRDRASVILGVDIGAAHVSVALTDLRGRILEWREEDHPVQSDPRGTADLAVRLGKACLAARGNGAPAPMGIGVAVPSPVDPGSPYRILERILPAWHAFDLLGVLRDHFEVPVFVDNDANLGALAEHHWGKAVGIDDFAYLKVATGIGAGLMIDGEIYRGATGVAGEIGHVAIDPRGPQCVCGNRGCLATFVGTAPLLSRIQALLPDFPQSVLNGAVADIRAPRGRRARRRPARAQGGGRGRAQPGHRDRGCPEPDEPGLGHRGREPGPARRPPARPAQRGGGQPDASRFGGRL